MASSLPLSPVHRIGDLVFTSGRVGTDPRTGSIAAFLFRPQCFETFTSVYREFFAEPFPARSTVSVELGSPEIEAIAHVAKRGDGR